MRKQRAGISWGWYVALSLVVACSAPASTSQGPVDGGASSLREAFPTADSGPVDDAFAAKRSDAALMPESGAPPDGKATASPACGTCVEERCDESAVACASSDACKAVIACMNQMACVNIGCDSSCAAGDMSLTLQALALLQCYDTTSEGNVAGCALPCSLPFQGTAEAGACVALQLQCDPLVPALATCCEGSCPASGGSCCQGAGGHCASNQDCCTGTCDLGSGMCAAMACYPSGSNCSPGSQSCCDPALECTAVPGPAMYTCCASVGAALPQGDSALCCSGIFAPGADGGPGTCAAPAVH